MFATLLLTLSLAACDSGSGITSDEEPDPEVPPIDEYSPPWSDEGLVAFLGFSSTVDEIYVAPFNDPAAYRVVTPDHVDESYSSPRISPDNRTVTFRIINGHGPSLIADLISGEVDTMFVESGIHISAASASVVWNESMSGFYFSEALSFFQGSQNTYHYSLAERSVTPKNTVSSPLGIRVGGDTLLVRLIEDGESKRILYDQSSGTSAEIPNPHLVQYQSPNTVEVGAVRHLDWNPDLRLFVGTRDTGGFNSRQEMFVTDLSGDLFQVLSTRGFDLRRPVWGPGAIILYERLGGFTDEIWATDYLTGEFRKWAAPNDFGVSTIYGVDY